MQIPFMKHLASLSVAKGCLQLAMWTADASVQVSPGQIRVLHTFNMHCKSTIQTSNPLCLFVIGNHAGDRIKAFILPDS